MKEVALSSKFILRIAIEKLREISNCYLEELHAFADTIEKDYLKFNDAYKIIEDFIKQLANKYSVVNVFSNTALLEAKKILQEYYAIATIKKQKKKLKRLSSP